MAPGEDYFSPLCSGQSLEFQRITARVYTDKQRHVVSLKVFILLEKYFSVLCHGHGIVFHFEEPTNLTDGDFEFVVAVVHNLCC